MIWFSLCSEVMLGECLNASSFSSVQLDVVFFCVSCRIYGGFHLQFVQSERCCVSQALVPIYHRRKTLGWLLLLLFDCKKSRWSRECWQRNDDYSHCVIVCSCGHARHFLRCLTGLSMGVTAWLVARYHLSPYVFDGHYTERLASSFFLWFWIMSVDFERWVWHALCFNKTLSKHSYLSYTYHISFFARDFPSSNETLKLLRRSLHCIIQTKACKPLRKWNTMPCGLPRHDETHNCTTVALTHFVPHPPSLYFSLSLSLYLSLTLFLFSLSLSFSFSRHIYDWLLYMY